MNREDAREALTAMLKIEEPSSLEEREETIDDLLDMLEPARAFCEKIEDCLIEVDAAIRELKAAEDPLDDMSWAWARLDGALTETQEALS